MKEYITILKACEVHELTWKLYIYIHIQYVHWPKLLLYIYRKIKCFYNIGLLSVNKFD